MDCWCCHYLFNININFSFYFVKIIDLVFYAGLVEMIGSSCCSRSHQFRFLPISKYLIQKVLLVLIRFLFWNCSRWSWFCTLKGLFWLFCCLWDCCVYLNFRKNFWFSVLSCRADLGWVQIAYFWLLRDRGLHNLFFCFFDSFVSAIDVSAQLRLRNKFAATVLVGTNKLRFLLLGFLLFLAESTPFQSRCPGFWHRWGLLFGWRWATAWHGWHFQI